MSFVWPKIDINDAILLLSEQKKRHISLLATLFGRFVFYISNSSFTCLHILQASFPEQSTTCSALIRI